VAINGLQKSVRNLATTNPADNGGCDLT